MTDIEMARIQHHPRLEINPPNPNMDQQGGQDRKSNRRTHSELPKSRTKYIVHPKADQRPDTTAVDVRNRSLG